MFTATASRFLSLGATAALLCSHATMVASAPASPNLVAATTGACSFSNGDLIALQADTGKFVARCNNCIPGGVYPDSAFVHATQTSGNPWAVWKVTNTGNGKLALQADSGKYLARCSNCAPGAAYPDSAFVHVGDWNGNPWAQWTCVDAGNGKIALQADSGNYLGRCEACVQSAQSTAFVHVKDWTTAPWAQFAVTRLPSPACTFTDGQVIGLQADTGKFLSRCNNCISGGAHPDSAFVHVPALAGNPWANWRVFNTGDGKLAFQSDSGKFLARCNNCAASTVSDMAFVHVDNWRGSPWAQFTCVDAGNGKIALQADSGNYVSRCNNCVQSAYPDSVSMDIAYPKSGVYAQWTVVKA